VHPCTAVFFNGHLGSSYEDQLRNHLLTHDEKSLYACGFNLRLLAEDRDRAEGRETPSLEA